MVPTLKQVILLLVYLILIVGMFAIFTGIYSYDFKTYTDAARALIRGRSQLYDSQSTGFFYMPWSILVLAPFSVLPLQVGKALFGLLTLAGTLWAIRVLSGEVSIWALALAMTTPFSTEVFSNGQWEGILLISVGLGWWSVKHNQPFLLGLALMGILSKPPNALLAMLLLLYAARPWSWKMFAVPVLFIGGSFVACGIDWPWRYLEFLQTSPPNQWVIITLWREFEVLNLPIMIAVIISLVSLIGLWRCVQKQGVGGPTLALALAVNLIITPYSAFYHYVLNAPAVTIAANRDWRWGIFIYLAMALTIARKLFLWPLPPLPFYPLAILVAYVALNGVQWTSPTLSSPKNVQE